MACKLKIKIENQGQKIHNSAHIVTDVFHVLFNDAANCYISTALVTDAMVASKKNDPKTKKVRLHGCADLYQYKTGDTQHMKMPPNDQVLPAPRCVKMNRIIMYNELEKMWKKMSVAKLKVLQVSWHFACRDWRKKHKISLKNWSWLGFKMCTHLMQDY